MSINQFKLKDLIMESWRDFLKKKLSKAPYQDPYLSRKKYTDVNKWIEDNLDDDNRYIGPSFFGNNDFPLRGDGGILSDFVPAGQEKFAMDGWNKALEFEQRKRLAGIHRLEKTTKKPGWLTT